MERLVSGLFAFAFCAATGFVFAATLSSLYQWVTSEPADFSIARAGLPGIAVVVVLSMFAGPFIVWQKVMAGLRTREINPVPATLGLALAGVWSVCAGIFHLSLLLAV